MNQNQGAKGAGNARVSIIVLNFNKFDLTKFFFENNQKYIDNVHWCLVDNGSDPEIVVSLVDYTKSKNWNIWKPGSSEEWVKVHEGNNEIQCDLVLLPQNLGYAKGNNHGIQFIDSQREPDYIMVVNNDVEWYGDVLSPLIMEIVKYDDLAVIAPRIVDPLGTEQNPQFLIEYTKMLQTFFRLGFPISTLLYNIYSKFFNFNEHNKELFKKVKDIFFLDTSKYCFMGSCFLIKYPVFKDVGFFDPNTFLGAEEPILVHKLREKKYCAAILPEITVIHNQGETSRSLFSAVQIMNFFEDSDEYYLRSYCHYSENRLKLIRLGRKYYMSIWLPLVIKFRQLRNKNASK